MIESARNIIRMLRSYVLWTGYSAGSLLLSLWLAWQLSAQVNFLYPAWYSLLEIDQTVMQTMPKHLYKKEFIATNTQEHHRLFSEIVTSIQNHGHGLEQIRFYNPSGDELGVLLTESEVIHLQDVANLLDILDWFALVMLMFCLLVMAGLIFFRMRMPTIKRLSMSMLVVVGLSVVAILLAGAKKFFYWLHTVIFPNEHQWFFYYEESLMSTLMQAPNLFAPISAMLLLLGLFIWLLHLLLLHKFAGFKTA